MPKLAKGVPVLACKQRDDGWWITGLPNDDCPECGPYRTRAEADEDRMGLQRFYRDRDAMLRAAAPPKGFAYQRDSLGGVKLVKTDGTKPTTRARSVEAEINTVTCRTCGNEVRDRDASPGPDGEGSICHACLKKSYSPMKLVRAVGSLRREQLESLLSAEHHGKDMDELGEILCAEVDSGRISAQVVINLEGTA